MYLGSSQALQQLLAAKGMVAAVGAPSSTNYQEKSYIDAMAEFGQQTQVRVALPTVLVR